MPSWNESANKVFLRALEHASPDRRRAYLDGVCGTDAELRAEVESLLEAREHMGGFLDSPAPEISATIDQSCLDRPGTQIGPYRLVRQLGHGGMGVVYDAEEISLGRRVALKVLPFAALLNEAQLQRFNTEATAAARLQHSGIVTIYSVGCERGIHFIAMQIIEGPSLAAVIAELRQERHPDEDQQSLDTVVARRDDVLTRNDDGGHYGAVARIGRVAAEALHYAHENGVLHRDIKPSNLLLDNSGHVWIADFGLARVEDESQLTRTGDILGTLRYMSPEAATGDRVDARSDVYSLGATLYELATLQPVFDAEDRRDIIKQVLAGNPISPHKVDDRIPKPLSYVISKSMARLDERYQSAQELADDLQRFLDGEAVSAKPPTLVRRSRAWARRHRLVSAAIVSLLILALLLPFTHHFFQRVPDDSPAKGPDMNVSKTAKVAAAVAAMAMMAGKPAKPPKVTVPNPTDLVVSAVTADSITLDWNSGGGTTAGFIVAYKEGTTYPKSNLRGATVLNAGNVESYTVPDLLTDQIYSFRVCAVDSNGKRSSGVTVQGTTASGAVPVEIGVYGVHHDPDTAIFGTAGRLIEQADGKLLFPGYYFDGVGIYDGFASILRWNANGTVDTDFGNDGKGSWIHDFGGPSSLEATDHTWDVAIQPDNKLVVVGSSDQYLDTWIARLNEDGSFDNSFGNNGKVEYLAEDRRGKFTSVLVLPSGSIIVAGHLYDFPMSLAFAKFTPSGVLDISFGDNGYSIINMGLPAIIHSRIYEVGDGGLLVAGTGPGFATSTIYKVNPNTGALITSFGNGGVAEIDFEPGGFEQFEDLAIQDDGKIVAVGGACIGENSAAVWWNDLPDKCSIARFNADGTVDATFADAGGDQLDLAAGCKFVQVRPLSNGKLIAFGYAGPDFHSRKLCLARFNSNGSLDSSFNGAGWVNFNLVGENALAGGMIVVDDLTYKVSATADDELVRWPPYIGLVWQLQD